MYYKIEMEEKFMNKKKNFKILISTGLIFCSFYCGVSATKEGEKNLISFKNCYNNIKKDNNLEKAKLNLNKSCSNIKTNIKTENKIDIKKSKTSTNLKNDVIDKKQQKSNESTSNLNTINKQENNFLEKEKEKKSEKKILLTKNQFKNCLFKNNIKKQKPTLDFRVTNDIIYVEPGPYQHNNINKDLDEYRKIIDKNIEKKTTEVQKLLDFYYYFLRLFKIFDQNCKEINRINDLIKTKMKFKNKPDSYSNSEGVERLIQIYEKNTDPHYENRTPESMYSMCLETFIKLHLEQSVNAYFTKEGIDVDNDSIEKILGPIQNQAKTMHKKVIFDIDTINNYLWIRLKKMLDCIEIINNLHNRFLTFIDNIKDKSLLNCRFAEEIIYYVKSEKIKITPFLSSHINPEYNKEYFNDRKAVSKLSSYVSNILEYSTRPEPIVKFNNIPKTEKALYIKQKQDYNEYMKSIDKLLNRDNNREYQKCSVPENIKEGIEIRREIAKIMEKIVQRELYRKIFKSLLTMAKREKEITNDVSPMLLFNLSDSQINKANDIPNK